MNHLSLDQSPVNWFDFLVVIVVLLGISRGRKHGMSVEMMVTLQWLGIVFAGAMLYRPLGDLLADSSPMSHLFCYITMYILVAIVVKTTFSLFKKALGGKLVGSSVFGGAEFYLGMVAGAVRFVCILIAGLALLNAPYYTTQQIAYSKAQQVDLYGSNFFPELSGVQLDIFRNSLMGSLIKDRAEFLLITSTKPEHKTLQKRKDELP
jgi:uncharacterized membrane protein required for colicin V production